MGKGLIMAGNPLFWERYWFREQGTREWYTRVKIMVWEGEADRFCRSRIVFSWLVLSDGTFGQPALEIDEKTWQAPNACKLAQRVLRALRPYGADATPSDLQAALQTLRARKCAADEQHNVHAIEVGPGQYLPV